MKLNRDKFFPHVRQHVFANVLTQSQVDGINSILDAWEARPDLTDDRWLAYMLATTKWETASTMQPVEEYGKGRGHSYGAPTGPWHQAYDGRGDVQLTWESNYRHATLRLRELGVIGPDVDLEKNPELAMRPDIAAAVMFYGMTEGWFTRHKLADYFNDRSDWTHARQIVNGMDHAANIAWLGQSFMTALQIARVPSVVNGQPAAG